ncbi:type VI secretion system contractile sheath domain-containing protein [Photobacterium lipolyticum]|uniref:Type VI secretion protein n=1 Tax=Photobacterium lipolyticum TaxID=266810 RepID=A0A2T3N0H0_9GAMM|nr:type VI secretion system contractile sheath large subunit [Photobacterium lipolyticum]PSW05703.1 type VI secretion protein [Photobacterium lipolyticum]
MTVINPTLSANVLTDLGPWRMLLEHAQQQDVSCFKAAISRVITQLDQLMSDQLSAVIQADEFQKLEASWSGLQSLVQLPVSGRRIKVKLLDFSWNMLSTDLNQAFEIRRSALFKKVYSNELDTAGGQPFGLLVVDHHVHSDLDEDSDFDDLYTLQLVAELGERSLCPVVLGVDNDFFGDEPARLVHDHARISRILTSLDLQSWQLLREHGSSRFLHLVLPEYCIRQPRRNCPVGFVFNEANTNKSVLWGNAAYLLAANVIREFDRISWFGFLRAHDNTGSHGVLVDLNGSICSPLKARIDIFSESDGFWADQGFVPVSSLYLSGQLGLFSNQSVWKPANEASKTSGMLQTNLMACRFGHYIKAKMRDRVGSFDSAATCQRDLEKWLQNYISNVDYGDESIMARYPLKHAEVRFIEDCNDATRYRCQIKLQPQYQYEMLDTHITLMTEVSSNKLGEA